METPEARETTDPKRPATPPPAETSVAAACILCDGKLPPSQSSHLKVRVLTSAGTVVLEFDLSVPDGLADDAIFVRLFLGQWSREDQRFTKEDCEYSKEGLRCSRMAI
jgi:hypothetical protein